VVRVIGLVVGLGAGSGAVGLAPLVAVRMGLVRRQRPRWWGAAAVGLGGLMGVLLVVELGDVWVLPAYWLFLGATLLIGLIDLDHRVIPNRVLFPAIAAGAGLLLIGAVIDGAAGAWLRALGGAAAYFMGLLLIALLARGGFGMGDVKLAILLGMFLGYLGWDRVLLGAVLAIFLGGLSSVGLLVSRRKGRADKFAYGPYLVVGAYIAVLYGAEVIDWYLRR